MGLNSKTIVLAALLVSVAMGCGDGKQKKRQPVRKTPGVGQKGTTPPGKTDPAKPGQPPKEGPSANDPDPKKTQEELAAKRKIEEKHEGLVAGLLGGQLMDKSALPEGEYTLKQFTAAFKYMPTTGGWMRAFRTQAVIIDKAGGVVLDDKAPTEGSGASANEPDAGGRVIETPIKFTVKKDGGTFRSDRAAYTEQVVVTTRASSIMNKGDFKVKIDNTLDQVPRVIQKASVQALLATDALENKSTNDLMYQDASKKIQLRIRKQGETKIRLIFEIAESDVMHRMVILDYDVEAAPAPAPAPTTAPPEEPTPAAPAIGTSEPG